MNKCRIDANGYANCEAPTGHHCDFARWTPYAMTHGGTCLFESGGACANTAAVIATAGGLVVTLPDHMMDVLRQIAEINAGTGWTLEENARRILCESLRQWRDRAPTNF